LESTAIAYSERVFLMARVSKGFWGCSFPSARKGKIRRVKRMEDRIFADTEDCWIILDVEGEVS
jgi:hypothetical protein